MFIAQYIAPPYIAPARVYEPRISRPNIAPARVSAPVVAQPLQASFVVAQPLSYSPGSKPGCTNITTTNTTDSPVVMKSLGWVDTDGNKKSISDRRAIPPGASRVFSVCGAASVTSAEFIKNVSR